jgi:hypothetical protein
MIGRKSAQVVDIGALGPSRIETPWQLAVTLSASGKSAPTHTREVMMMLMIPLGCRITLTKNPSGEWSLTITLGLM